MNVDCVSVRWWPNNSISGGRDAPPLMLSVSLPESRRSRQADSHEMPDADGPSFISLNGGESVADRP